MRPSSLPRGLAVALVAVALSACGGATPASPPVSPAQATSDAPRIVQPGAPGEATRVVDATQVTRTALPHTEADVRFMQGMIPHHAQALEMSALVEERTDNRDIRLLAKRIDISQRDEIALMTRWLQAREAEVPGEHAHHMMGDHALMPGMLTPAQMGQLRNARGADFERLFLEFMISHHEGALFMVRELFSSPGAGQETEIFTFASHVDADQHIEIQRMGQMLAAYR